MAILICLNCLVIFGHDQWEGFKVSVELGTNSDSHSWLHYHADNIFEGLEYFFCMAFATECLVKGWLLRSLFWKGFWNAFDLFLVVTSSVNLFLLKPLGGVYTANILVLRLGRTLRLVMMQGPHKGIGVSDL